MPISLREDSRLPGGEYTSWNKCQEFKLRIFTPSTAVVPLYFSIDRFQNIVLIPKRRWKPLTLLKYLISLYLSEILMVYKVTSKHFLSLASASTISSLEVDKMLAKKNNIHFSETLLLKNFAFKYFWNV